MTQTTISAVLDQTEEQPPMPDVPAAMILALVQAIIGLVIAFGVDVSDELQAAILQLTTAALVVLPLADAYLRGKRNDRLATVQATAIAATTPQLVPEGR